MTRRLFTNLLIGFSLALPVRFEHRKQAEPTTVVQQECGPVSPLRKAWPEFDRNKFLQDSQMDWIK